MLLHFLQHRQPIVSPKTAVSISAPCTEVPRLPYGNAFWGPFKCADQKTIERVQRQATSWYLRLDTSHMSNASVSLICLPCTTEDVEVIDQGVPDPPCSTWPAPRNLLHSSRGHKDKKPSMEALEGEGTVKSLAELFRHENEQWLECSSRSCSPRTILECIYIVSQEFCNILVVLFEVLYY